MKPIALRPLLLAAAVIALLTPPHAWGDSLHGTRAAGLRASEGDDPIVASGDQAIVLPQPMAREAMMHGGGSIKRDRRVLHASSSGRSSGQDASGVYHHPRVFYAMFAGRWGGVSFIP